MSTMTKSQQVEDLFVAGDFKAAFGIIRTFRVIPQEDKVLYKKAHEYLTHPQFYTQITTPTQRENVILEAKVALHQWVKQRQNATEKI